LEAHLKTHEMFHKIIFLWKLDICKTPHWKHHIFKICCGYGKSCLKMGRSSQWYRKFEWHWENLPVQRIINNLNIRFPNLPIFNATRLFSSKHLLDDLDRNQMTETWLARFVSHFQWASALINWCNAKLLEFIEMLSFEC
jgi:hypothetical protein